MADNTKIEWTDATWNPITGCSIVSPGCTNCYAMKLAGTRLQHHPSRVGLTKDSKAGPVWTGEVRFNPEWLTQPLTWKKPRMIFVCAHGDLFAEGVPDEWIDQVFAVMALAPHHTFQVLTKRPERMREYLYGDSARQRIAWAEAAKIMNIHAPHWRDEDIHGANRSLAISAGQEWPLPNVWLGVSVEDQPRAEQRIPILLDTPAAIRWISAEPLLGGLDLRKLPSVIFAANINALTGTLRWDGGPTETGGPRLDWVVAGGESGRNARPMHPDWARSLRDQCAAAGVPFLFKQWGEWHTAAYRMTDGEPVFRQFTTFDQWVNKASTWINGGVCLDRTGRRLKIGGDFMRARDKGTFPLTIMHRVGKKSAGRVLDGVEHNGFPEVQS
ncbi:phage Gp37/Gp68 family protein [Agrobacterium vitis]|uniref:phage Gp37/Gp68 family protein n=1 Tax=Agrobacterium vitis TaxID=373 RepID=UPI0015740381|nr:phage Gp37/Gp68 family protein [Agrobacterium vitis]NTA34359.1 phage Gp37/Gp68 family protein [Agrobacterium vitis]